MNQVRIHKFLEKTKKKTVKVEANEGGESADSVKEHDILRKKVTNLLKKQKLRQVKQIIKGNDDVKPWSQAVRAKVCIFNKD